MRRLFAALMPVLFLLWFAGTASGSVITGKVTLDFKHKPDADKFSAYKPLAGADVRIMSRTHVPLADGVIDAQGKFEIADVPVQDGQWLVITAATGTESLSGIYTGKDMVLDPVSDALARSVFMNQNVVGNFTLNEIELIKAGLYAAAAAADLSKADTAAGAVEALISYEPFRLALGDMLFTYSSPGDNIADVQDIVTALDAAIPNLHKMDAQSLAAYAAPDAAMEFEGQSYSADALLSWIRDFNKRVDVKEWNVTYSRFAVQGDAAHVETIENVFFVSRDNKEEIRDSFFFMNDIVKTDGKWLVQKRYEPECAPIQARILADKSSWDWVGANPCMLSFHGKATESGYRAALYSVYYAMDEVQFYWRMEVDTTQIREAMNSGSVNVSFMISLLDRIDGEPKKDVYSVVGVKNAVAYSVNQVRRTAPDGFPEQLTYLPNNFIVTPGYVEGTISLEELKALGQEFYANARIMINTDKATSQILSEGIPIIIRLGPDY